MIAIVVLTYNRVHLLRKCVENVLDRASDATAEIVIWNNASTDGTREYLESLDNPRLRMVNHDENIGQNGYARAFALTSADYLIELDEIVAGCEREAARVAVLAYVLRTVDDLQPRVVQRVEIVARAVGRAVVPDHDLARRVGGPREHVLDALAQEVDAVVREDDDGDRALGRSGALPCGLGRRRGFHALHRKKCRDGGKPSSD